MKFVGTSFCGFNKFKNCVDHKIHKDVYSTKKNHIGILLNINDIIPSQIICNYIHISPNIQEF